MRRSCFLAAFVLVLFALPACETVEGMKEDISSIGMPDFAAMGEKKTAVHSQCPEVHIVEELATLNEFTDRANPGPSNRITRVDINRVESSCSRGKESVTVDLKLAFEGKLGPKGRSQGNDVPFFSHPFFVAITAPNGDILAKEVFAASITYERGQDHNTYYESLRQIIPVKYETTAHRYKVLVGFQLDNDQLAYNREQIELAKEAAKKKGQTPPEADPAFLHAGEPEPAIEIIEMNGQPNSDPIDLTVPQ